MNQKLARRAQNQSLSGMGESLGQEDISGSGVNQDIIFPAVILSGLDALTTEDSVLNILGSLTKLPMKSVRIGRDPLTNMSRGVCYVEMNSVVDSKFLHNQLIADPPLIDGRQVQVSYDKQAVPQVVTNTSQNQAAANLAMEAAQLKGKKVSDKEIQKMTSEGSEEETKSSRHDLQNIALDILIDLISVIVCSPSHEHGHDDNVTKVYRPMPKIFSCEKCSRKFSQFKSFQNHKKNGGCVNKLKFVVCDICKKSLSDNRSLRRHKQSFHTMAKSFDVLQCIECAVTFSTKNKQKVHNSLKHGEDIVNTEALNNYKFCQVIGCEFKHLKASCLKAHFTRVHATVEKVKCTICPFQCLSESGMKKHLRAVHIVSSIDMVEVGEAKVSIPSREPNKLTISPGNLNREKMISTPNTTSVNQMNTVARGNLDGNKMIDMSTTMSINQVNTFASSSVTTADSFDKEVNNILGDDLYYIDPAIGGFSESNETFDLVLRENGMENIIRSLVSEESSHEKIVLFEDM